MTTKEKTNIRNRFNGSAGMPEYGKQYRLTGGSNQPSIASGNTWAESEAKNEKFAKVLSEVKLGKCPACGEPNMDPIDVRNALSRYCDEYICSQCGMREAFEGDFWFASAQFGKIRKGAN